MDIYVLNKDLETVGVIDTYISVIWTPRYYTSGDFELYVGATTQMLELLKVNYFLVREKDIDGDEMRNVMQIKNIDLKNDPENGNTLIVMGKSISAIVGQRVVSAQTSLSGQLQEVIHMLLIENLIHPLFNARKILNFKFELVEGLNVLRNKVEMQVTGDNLEEFISTLCEKYNIGWDVYIKNGNFVFYLYAGTDRSFDQNVNPYIVFSSDFDNLVNSDYQYLTEDYKNVAIVAGEGQGVNRVKTIVGTAEGINRFETWVDAKDVSANEGGISNTEYMEILQDKGTEALTEYVHNQLFDGETDTTTQYVLNRDFFLGDVVQIVNDYGITAKARILEIIESEDDSGTSVIPTFSTMTFDDEPVIDPLTHGDMRVYTHGELAEFTHEEIEEGAI